MVSMIFEEEAIVEREREQIDPATSNEKELNAKQVSLIVQHMMSYALSRGTTSTRSKEFKNGSRRRPLKYLSPTIYD